MLSARAAFAGTASEFKGFLEDQIRSTGINYFVCDVAFRDLTSGKSMQTVKLLGEEIIPKFGDTHLHDDTLERGSTFVNRTERSVTGGNVRGNESVWVQPLPKATSAPRRSAELNNAAGKLRAQAEKKRGGM